MKNSYHPYAFTTILLWASAFVFTRFALEHFSPLPLGFLRYLVAAVALVPMLFKKLTLPKARDIPWFILSGGLGFFLYMVFFNIGVQTVTSATASVIMAISPVLTALLATPIFHEPLRRYQWGAIGLEFCGILVLALVDGILSMNSGVFWVLGAAASLAGYNLIQRRLTKSYTPIQATTYSIFTGTLMLCVFAPAAFTELKGAPLKALLSVVALGIFVSAIGYLLWAVAFQKAPRTSSVSNYMFLNPVLSSILGFFFLGEVPAVSTVIGGVIILTGAVLFNRENFRPVKGG